MVKFPIGMPQNAGALPDKPPIERLPPSGYPRDLVNKINEIIDRVNQITKDLERR